MSQTTFSGPVASGNGFIALAVHGAAALLADATDALNTTAKVAGKQVVDLDDGLIYTAIGSSATNDWVASNGTSSITPA